MARDARTLTFDSFNELRKTSGSNIASVTVLGKVSPNDGDGGIFYWDELSTLPDDNQNVLQKSGLLTGRWLRASFYSSDSDTTYTAGSGIAISPTNVISNTAQDKIVTLIGTGSVTISGTYPNFTIDGANPLYSGMSLSELITGTSVANRVISAKVLNDWIDSFNYLTVETDPVANSKLITVAQGAGISISEGPQTVGSNPFFTVVNTSPDQIVSITGGENISVTGTYPNFTISGSDLDAQTLSWLESTNTLSISGGNSVQITGFEESFLKGSLLAGTGVSLTGDLLNRLVGTGDITISAVPVDLSGYVPKSTTITINGVTQDLSTNRTWTVGLEEIGTPGTYTKVTTDEFGRVVAGTSLVASDLPIEAGSGINIVDNAGTAQIINTAPDQIVSLVSGANIVVTGTYPNFVISAIDLDSQTLSWVDSTNTLSITGGNSVEITGFESAFAKGSLVAGTGVSLSGTLTNRLVGAGNITISATPIDLSGYYTKTEINSFFDGTTPITGYNKVNWDTAYDNSVTGISFNPSTGVFTLTQQDLGTLTTNMDGRYIIASDLNNLIEQYLVNNLDAGTGISITNSLGVFTVANTLPDQVVTITGGGSTTVTGTYPNFNITSTGEIYTAGDNINISGTNVISADDTNLSSSVVGNTVTINSSTGTGTSFNIPVDVTYIEAGADISVAGIGTQIDPYIITNEAPDQIVTINSGTNVNVTGTYPNFTISSVNTDAQTLSWNNATDTLAISGGNSVVITGFEPTLTKGSLVAGTGVSLTGTLTNRLIGTGNVTINATPVDLSNYVTKPTTITINGVVQDLSTDRVWTIPTADGSETKLTAGSNISITGTGTTTTPYVISTPCQSFGWTPATKTLLSSCGTSVVLTGILMDTATISGGFGVDVTGDWNTGYTVVLDTTDTDLRYLRKDVDDDNGVNTLSLGSLLVNNTVEFLNLPAGDNQTDFYLTIDGAGEVRQVTSPSPNLDVANSAGAVQFGVDLLTENLKFSGTGDTTISFNPSTNTVTINSTPGSGGGGVVTSVDASITGALSVTGGPITSSGTFVFDWEGLTTQYVRGDGSLATFPTIPTNTVPNTRTLTINGTAGRTTVTPTGAQNLTANRLWTVDLATAGTAGTYTKVTTDAYGRVTSGSNITFTDLPIEAGTGISITDNAGVATITNTSPDQIVSLTGAGSVSITGTYPSFTISGTNTTYSGMTLVELNTGTATTNRIISAKVLTDWLTGFGYIDVETDPIFTASPAFGITGTNITNWNNAYNNTIVSSAFNTTNGNLTLTQQDAGTIVTNLDGRYLLSADLPIYTAGDNIQISPSYVISATDTTYTAGTGINISVGNVISSTGVQVESDPIANAKTVTLNAGAGIDITGTTSQTVGANPEFTIINNAPDQTVVLNDGTGISVTGMYPNFTINATNTTVGTVTSFSAGNLSPLFTTSVSNATTTPALSFALPTTLTQYQVFGRSAAGTGAPSWVTLDNVAFTGNYSDLSGLPTIPSVTPSTLSRVNDTNVTLTLGGTPGTALLQNVSMTLGWQGTLSVARGGTGLTTSGPVGSILQSNGTSWSLVDPPWTTNTGTVTSVAAGNGMNFPTITGAGTVTMGTPSPITASSVNGVTATSHTHELAASSVVTAKIANSNVTFAKIQNIPTQTLLGRYSAGTGVTQSITLDTSLTLSSTGVLSTTNNGTVTGVSSTVGGTALNVLVSTPTTTPSLAFTWGGTSSQYVNGVGNLVTFPSIPQGTVESVALTMPSAFTVTGSPITSSGTFTVSGAGTASQYITGEGTLATFPTIPQGTVTSVSAGNGMVFSTITSSGPVTMGIPSPITLTSLNVVTETSHTHDFDPGGTTLQYITGAGTLATFPSLNNIYNSDGVLSSNRTLSGNGQSLTFTGLSNFSTTADQFISFDSDDFSATADNVSILGELLTYIESQDFRLRSNGDFAAPDATAKIQTSLLKETRTFQFPDQSGTIALLSDISGAAISLGDITSTTIDIDSNGVPVVTLPPATTTLAGLMRATDKAKLDGIESGANNYVLPVATATALGGIELFSNTVQATAANTVSSTTSRTYGLQLNAAGQGVINVPWTNTTYTAGSGLTLTGTIFSLPVTITGTGTFVESVVQNANGITVTKGTPIGTTYTSSNGIILTGTNFTPNYGTTAGTIAQGNDSRIINGQTAFGWGNHALAGYELQSNKVTTLTSPNNTTYPTTQAVVNYVTTIAGNYIPISEKGAINGVATLGADGKLPNSQIPAIAITDTFVVATEAAMLALSSAEQGDVAVRTDLSKTFILVQPPASTLSNWQELLTPTDALTNLSLGTATGTTRAINNSNGTGVTLPAVTTTLAGLMTAADKVKLNGIATGATANQTDAYLLNRANHTGVQAISTITGLQADLDGKELLANKSTSTTLGTSNILYPTQNAVKTYVDNSIGSIATPNLQQVTDVGATTTNPINIGSGVNSLTLNPITPSLRVIPSATWSRGYSAGSWDGTNDVGVATFGSYGNVSGMTYGYISSALSAAYSGSDIKFKDGKVGINLSGSTVPGYNLQVTGDGRFSGLLNTEAGLAKAQGNTRVFDKVLQNHTALGPTGIASIYFPQATESATMFNVLIKMYGYNNRYLGEFNIAFYKQNSILISAAGRNAMLQATENFPTNVVKAGIDAAGNVRINIGEATTAWSSYVSLEVVKVETKFTGYASDWSQGWAVEYLTAEPTDYVSLVTIPVERLASRDWVAGNYVTSNTDQLTLSGNKTTTGTWDFRFKNNTWYKDAEGVDRFYFGGNIQEQNGFIFRFSNALQQFQIRDLVGQTKAFINQDGAIQSDALASGGTRMLTTDNNGVIGATSMPVLTETDPVYTASIPNQMMFKGLIPDAADLDTYIETGIYHQNQNGWAENGTNYPSPFAGVLEVKVANTSSFVYQTYTTYGIYNRTYKRTKYLTTWGSWVRITDATVLDNYYASGQQGIPVKGGDYLVHAVGGYGAEAIDYNTKTGAGFYKALANNLSVNGPTSTYHYLQNILYNVDGTGSLTQIAWPYRSANDDMWIRSRFGATWQPWNKVWTSRHFTDTDISNWNTAFGWGNFRDYGLGWNGVTGRGIPGNSLDDITTPNGLYAVTPTTIGNPVASSGTVIIERSGANSYVTQKVQLINAGDIDRMFIRHYMPSTSTWSTWRELYHTGNFANGTTSQYIRGDGSLATFPTLTSGTVTSVTAGNGMNFSTITGAGAVTLGTPSDITASSTNSVGSTTHSHALAANAVTTTKVANLAITDAKIADVAWSKVTGAPGFVTENLATANLELLDGISRVYNLFPNSSLTMGGIGGSYSMTLTPTSVSLLAGSNRSIVMDGTAGITIKAGSFYYTNLSTVGLTANRNIVFPDGDGTLALAADVPPAYVLPTATSSILGGVKLIHNTVQTVGTMAPTAVAGRSYPIQLNASDQMVVNVPWTDNNTTYTGSTSITLSGTSFQRAALTGDVTAPANSNATTIATSAVTYTKFQNVPTQTLLGRGAAGTGNVGPVTIGTGLTLSSGGVLSADVVTDTNIANSDLTTPISVTRTLTVGDGGLFRIANDDVSSYITIGGGGGDPSIHMKGVAGVYIDNLAAVGGTKMATVSGTGELGTAILPESGTWNPTIISSSNAVTPVFEFCSFIRIGEIVSISGLVTVAATSAAAANIIFTVPISSTDTKATGNVTGENLNPIGPNNIETSGSNSIRMNYSPSSTGGARRFFTGHYQIN